MSFGPFLDSSDSGRDLESAERKVKDLQLRLKRFAKDDQLKDEKIMQMEKEFRELSEHSRKLEEKLETSNQGTENNNQPAVGKDDSKVCVIL